MSEIKAQPVWVEFTDDTAYKGFVEHTASMSVPGGTLYKTVVYGANGPAAISTSVAFGSSSRGA